MGENPLPVRPMQVVSADLIGPLAESSDGNRYALTMTLIKTPHTPIKTPDSPTVDYDNLMFDLDDLDSDDDMIELQINGQITLASLR